MLTQGAVHSGLFERLVAVTGAAALAVLAIGILRRTRGTAPIGAPPVAGPAQATTTR